MWETLPKIEIEILNLQKFMKLDGSKTQKNGQRKNGAKTNNLSSTKEMNIYRRT